jgi:hypothetical protein
MYNKLSRFRANFQTMVEQIPDGAGGVTAASRQGYSCNVHIKSTSSFYGNYGGVRNEEGGQIGTDQSFECMVRYNSEYQFKTTTVMVFNNKRYALSDITNVDFKNQWITFKATVRND